MITIKTNDAKFRDEIIALYREEMQNPKDPAPLMTVTVSFPNGKTFQQDARAISVNCESVTYDSAPCGGHILAVETTAELYPMARLKRLNGKGDK